MLIDRCSDFVLKILKAELHHKSKAFAADLPVYFKRDYRLYKGEIKGSDCMVITSDSLDSPSVKMIKKRFELLAQSLNSKLPFVYVANELDWYTRDKFIDNGISFVVPGKQLYLPFIAVAIEEDFNETGIIRKKFSPSAQYLLIEILTLNKQAFKISDFPNVQMTKMSISRALKELTDLRLLQKQSESRTSFWTIGDNRQAWKDAEEYLFNPVMKTMYVGKSNMAQISKYALAAGETALAESSLLSLPRKEVYAISSKDWRSIEECMELASAYDEESIAIQVWKHPVSILDESIHPLALAVSFNDEKDERILESLEGEIEAYWLTREN